MSFHEKQKMRIWFVCWILTNVHETRHAECTVSFIWKTILTDLKDCWWNWEKVGEVREMSPALVLFALHRGFCMKNHLARHWRLLVNSEKVRESQRNVTSFGVFCNTHMIWMKNTLARHQKLQVKLIGRRFEKIH